MKKIFYLLVLFIVLNISFVSKAETLDDVVNYLNGEGFTISSTAMTKLQAQVNAANNYYNNSFGVAYVLGGSGSSQAVNIGLVPKATIDLLTYSSGKWKYNNTNNNYNCQCTIYYCSGSNGSYTINNEWLSDNNTSVNISMSPISKYGKYDFVPPIDWDTVYYSANIQAPNFDVTYRELSSTPIVDVPLDVHMNFVPNNVYIEMDAVYRIPERIDAVYGRIGGYEYYTNPSDKAHLYQKVIEKEDMVFASNASESYIHLALTDAWEDLYDLIPISELDWYFESDYSQEIKDKLKSRYENLRKICCFYGNEVQIIVRYFTIVNNTQFVVGPWRIWDCAKPNSFTDELPTWYEPYLPASGNTSTSTNTGSNSQSEPDVITIPYGDGEPTGVYYNPTTTITVNPNVPNYPDYPTIATYNKDHLLVDTMNGVKSLNGFFGEMVEFLTVSFAFIPGYIWTIIAVGFSLSIIVMFLKIL